MTALSSGEVIFDNLVVILLEDNQVVKLPEDR
jgi:hypothetical protein